jgi:uncharacterized protein (TIGR03067 family)
MQRKAFGGRRKRIVRSLFLLCFLLCAIVVLSTRTSRAEDQPPDKNRGLYGGAPGDILPAELAAVAFDHEGVLWLGSRSSGVQAFQDGRFSLFDQYNTTIPDAGIAAICVDSQNTKWFATRRGYLYSFDNAKWQIHKLDARATCLCADNKDRIWIGTESGLLRCNHGKIEAIRPNLPDDPEFRGGEVHDLDVDNRGRVWVAFRRGMLRFDGTQWSLVADPDRNRGAEPFQVACEPLADRIVLATSVGLFRVAADQWQPIAGAPQMRLSVLCVGPGGRLVAGSDRGGFSGKADKFTVFGEDSSLQNAWITGVAIAADQLAVVTRHSGLHLLRGDKWQSYVPKSDEHSIERGSRLAWRRQYPQELLQQPVAKATIREVLKNPLKFANKKVRVTGHIDSSFEYAEMVDADGTKLGMWPENYGALHRVLEKANLQKPLADKTQQWEFLGYLDWGGYFGHMGGSPRQFNIVEMYPADATPEKKAEIKQAYIKQLEEEAPLWPILADQQSTEAEAARKTLSGSWRQLIADRRGAPRKRASGPRWIIAKNRIRVEYTGGRRHAEFRIDRNAKPPRLDIVWTGDMPYRHDMELAIYRLDGDRLTINSARLGEPRPSDFVATDQFGHSLVELVREGDVPAEPDPATIAKDDPVAAKGLQGSRAGLQRDEHGNIVSVRFGSYQGPEVPKDLDQYLALLPKLPHLESVNIFLGTVTDEGFKHLADCPNLKVLTLQDYPLVTDAGLEHFDRLTKLETLMMFRINITNVGAAKFAGMRALKMLVLNDTQVTGELLQELPCPDLQSLSLTGPQVEDRGLDNLARFPKLVSLALANSRISDATLTTIGQLRDLEHLTVSAPAITDAGLAELASLAKLQSLDLSKTAITDASSALLGRFSQLQTLNLSDTRLTSAGLKALASLKGLEFLQLNNLKLTAADIAALEALPDLRYLSVHGMPLDDQLIAAVKRLKGLRQLTLSDPPVEMQRAQAWADETPNLSVGVFTGTTTMILQSKAK